MKSELFQAICRMGIFVICAQSIVHFRPKASYEKYLKMLVSIMVLIQIFLPVGQLIFGSARADFAARTAEFKQKMEVGMEEARENARQSEEKLEQMTLEEVNRRLALEAEEESGESVEGEKEADKEPQKEPCIGEISLEISPVEIAPAEAGGQQEQGDV